MEPYSRSRDPVWERHLALGVVVGLCAMCDPELRQQEILYVVIPALLTFLSKCIPFTLKGLDKSGKIFTNTM